MTYSISISGTKEHCRTNVESATGPGAGAVDAEDFAAAKARVLAFIERCKDGATLTISVSGSRNAEGAGGESSSLSAS